MMTIRKMTGYRWLLIFGANASGVFLLISLAAAFFTQSAHADTVRETLSLDGEWDIAESMSPNRARREFAHRGPVPGLAHSATPAFEAVDLFDSNEQMEQARLFAEHKNPDSDWLDPPAPRRLPARRIQTPKGISYQPRNYFWYRTHFTTLGARARAILKVNKAQYGSQVWMNGRPVGSHDECATVGYYDVTRAIRWNSQNEVLIRIGAHPGAMAGGTGCQGTTPGIWDSVSLQLSDDPRIENIQIAPRIDSSTVVIQTRVKNYTNRDITFPLRQAIHERLDTRTSAQQSKSIVLAAGEEKTITQTLEVPAPKLWTPETPNLYVVETTTGGDSLSTRFGMREFHCDTPTKRCYLNGKPYFMRGSNLVLADFLQDSDSKQLPWQESWVRRLLVTLPKRLHWNSFRSFSGTLPEKWLDIADEAGLLIQYEFPFDHSTVDEQNPETRAELIAQYSQWMRDHWNHPSLVIWDSSNECIKCYILGDIVRAVRPLDLSNRPWENTWNPPVGPDDPVEVHPYKFMFSAISPRIMRWLEIPVRGDFDMTELETLEGAGRDTGPPTGHTLINNEYGYLWLDKGGNPTLLSKRIYPKLPYPHATADERFETYAYLLSGLTEYWRAYRNFAAVEYFAYLLSSRGAEGGCAHNFRDVKSLELEPHFESYMTEAFKPLGVYINFWQRSMPAGAAKTVQVMMVNDEGELRNGKLLLTLKDEAGAVVSQKTEQFSVAPYGQQTYLMTFETPRKAGNFVLEASADAGGNVAPTLSRRHLTVVAQ